MIQGYILSRETPNTVYIDTMKDMERMPEYCAENVLLMGSECICIEDGSRFLLNSLGQWVKQPS